MKENGLAFETSLNLRDAGQVVNAAFARAKASVEQIQSSNNPLDGLDGVPDLAVVGSRQGMMNQWAVQAYFTKLDAGTGVQFIALGDGAGSRMMSGARNSASLSKSNDQMRQLVVALRAADPQLREV